MGELITLSELAFSIAPVAILTLFILSAGAIAGYKSRDREVALLHELAQRGKRMDGRKFL